MATSPTFTTNSVELQKVFDALKEYLDLNLIEKGDLSAQFSNGPGIFLTIGDNGQINIEADFEVFTPEDPWQLLRVATRLYVLPGFVHYPIAGTNELKQVVGALDDGIAPSVPLTDEPRPFFNLPLVAGANYTVYIVIDDDHVPNEAHVHLIRDGVEDIQDFADTDSTVMILHQFQASVAESFEFGTETTLAGFPNLSDVTTRIRSDIVLGGQGPTTQMFDMVVVDKPDDEDDQIKFSPGIYMRDGNVAYTSDFTIIAGDIFTRDIDFIPGLVAPDVVWVYAILNDTDDLRELRDTDDFTLGSTDFNAGGKLQILFKQKPFTDDPLSRPTFDPFRQFKLIAILKLTPKGGGKFEIEKVHQTHRGVIDATSEAWNSSSGLVGSPLDDVLRINYGFTMAVPPITTGQGDMLAQFTLDGLENNFLRNKRRLNINDTAVQVDLNKQFHYVALQDPGFASWINDVNLNLPTGTDVGMFHETIARVPSNTEWGNWYKLAYETTKIADGAHTYFLFTLYPNNWNALDGFWMRPDGIQINEPTGKSSLIDSDNRRARSMDYNTDAVKSEGVLQWFRLHEDVVTSPTIGNFTNDIIIGAFTYQTAGTVDLKYYRIDAGLKGLSTSALRDQPMSLQITADSTRLQVFAFDTITDPDAPGVVSGGVLSPGDQDSVADWFDIAANPTDAIEKRIMVRCRTLADPLRPYIGYADLSAWTIIWDQCSINPLNDDGDPTGPRGQVHNFKAASDIGQPDSGDLILLKDLTTGCMAYADWDHFAAPTGAWDQCSIDGPNGGVGQIFNWATAASVVTPLDEFDLLTFKDNTTGCMAYVSLIILNQSLDGKSHHALPTFNPVLEVIGSGWSDFDDHGGPPGNKIGGGTLEIEDGFALMLLGSPNSSSKAVMYDRNPGDSFLGNSLFVETILFVDDIHDESGTNKLRVDVQDMRLMKDTVERVLWDHNTTDVAIAANARFFVLNTNLADASSAMVVEGGALFVNDSATQSVQIGLGTQAFNASATSGSLSVDLCDFGSARAAFFFRGSPTTVTVVLSADAAAGAFVRAGKLADLSTVAEAGKFQDGTRIVSIADGTNAITVTAGDIDVVAGVVKMAGTQVLTTQQTGIGTTPPVRTAGATYGATEQTMLQEAHDMARLLATKLKVHGLVAT